MERDINPCSPHVTNVVSFLTGLFEQNYSNSTINNAKSTIAALNMGGQSDKYTHLINKFMKGVFNKRPALPRYNTSWDPEQVLNLFRNWEGNRNLSFTDLTLKTVSLLTLLSGRRGQTIKSIKINNIFFDENEMKINLDGLQKTSKRGFNEPGIVIERYEDKKLCLVDTVQAYLRRTEQIRGGEEQLFISHTWPFKKVSRDTLSRYLKQVLSRAGVDTTVFKSHSMRSALVSKATKLKVSTATILAAIGWRQESTFAKFYNKPLNKNSGVLASTVLKNSGKN